MVIFLGLLVPQGQTKEAQRRAGKKLKEPAPQNIFVICSHNTPTLSILIYPLCDVSPKPFQCLVLRRNVDQMSPNVDIFLVSATQSIEINQQHTESVKTS